MASMATGMYREGVKWAVDAMKQGTFLVDGRAASGVLEQVRLE